MGVAAAPVIGVTEGLSTVAHGMGAAVNGPSAQLQQRRCPRVFFKTADGMGPLCLTPYDPLIATCQASMEATLSASHNKPDGVNFVYVSRSNTQCLIFGQRCFYLSDGGGTIQEFHPWQHLSHLSVGSMGTAGGDGNAAAACRPHLLLHVPDASGRGEATAIRIDCVNLSEARHIYNLFYRRARKAMHAPTKVTMPLYILHTCSAV